MKCMGTLISNIVSSYYYIDAMFCDLIHITKATTADLVCVGDGLCQAASSSIR